MVQENNEELSRDLVDLLKLGWEIQEAVGQMGATGVYGWPAGGLEERVKKYLELVRGVAQKFGCTGYSISAGFPLGISASLDFSTQ